MPNIQAQVREHQDGQYTTYFVDSVGTTAVPYTYPNEQKSIVFTNLDEDASITLVVGGDTRTVAGGEQVSLEPAIPFTTLSVQAASGIRAFSALTTRLEGEDVDAITGFFDDFKGRALGSITGQGPWTAVAGTFNVVANGLSVSSMYSANARGLMLQRTFTNGRVRVLVRTGNNKLLLSVRHRLSDNQRYCVWVGATNVEFGRMAGISLSPISGGSVPGLAIPAGKDFWIELSMPTAIFTGAIAEVRVWAVDVAYPGTASYTYTFTGTDPVINEGQISLVSTVGNANAAIIGQIEVIDGNTPVNKLKTQNHFAGYWLPTLMNGKTTMTTINQGSEILTVIEGTRSIVANFFVDPATTAMPTIAYSIDGGALTRATVGSTAGTDASVTLATGLLPGKHTVKIIAAGIIETDPVWNQGAGIHFQGFTVDEGAVIQPWKTGKKIIEYRGDSITAGINVLGTGANPTVNAGEQAYPHICCNVLGAEPRQIGFGLTGIMQPGNGGVPQASQNFPYYMNGVTANETAPDVIVINHGTNDRNQTAAAFQPAYQAYVTQVMQRYPGVPVFLVRPFGGYQAAGVQAVANATPGTYYVDTTGWGVTNSDTYHPNAAGSITAGQKLAAEIQKVLGTSFFK